MVPSVASATADRPADVAIFRVTRACLLVLFSYLFLANGWLGDDAYITFRVIWNWVHGFGLTFNPDERVQAYTHPLWMLVMAAAHFITREFFFTATVMSWGFCTATLLVLLRWAKTPQRAAVLVLWLLSSKAFVDYTGSGLENPLTYLLVALFYTRYLDRPWGVPPETRELRLGYLLASLAFLSRPDAVVLFAIPLAEMTWQVVRRRPARALTPILIGAAPAVVWLGFATFYYGFPLPNTYYAKVANGIPKLLLYKQGLAYLANSIRFDPLTLGTVALACLVAWKPAQAGRRAALSAALYVAYTVSVGGDFMSGRFFAAPFLVSTMVLAPAMATLGAPWAIGALLVYNVITPLVPIKTTARYEAGWPWRSQNGIKDERAYYFPGTNVLFFSPFRRLPEFVWVHEGESFRAGSEKVTVQGSIGFWGLYAGPAKFLVDRNALSDPLLARLPVSPRLYFEFYAGHYFRDIPEGYLESVGQDANLLTDPLLRDYYERIRNVTRGSLLRTSRLRDILALNVGRYRAVHEQVLKRRATALSIRVDNERFTTDVGERDPAGFRASGRPGYLLLGPGIPAAPGLYRARFIGTSTAPPGTRIGYAEAWLDPETRVARVPVIAGSPRPDHVLGAVDFTVPRGGTLDLEYRFFAEAGAPVTLERAELYSGQAIPPEQ